MSDSTGSDPVREEFKRKFTGKARFNLLQQYEKWQRNFPDGGDVSPSPTDDELITFAQSEGLLEMPRSDKDSATAQRKLEAHGRAASKRETTQGPEESSSAETRAVKFKKLFADVRRQPRWDDDLSQLFDLLEDMHGFFWIGGRNAPLTPESLMLGILRFGFDQVRRDNTSYVASKMARAVSIDPTQLAQLHENIVAHRADDPGTEVAGDLTTPETKRIFDLAESIVRDVQADGKITFRHLVTALLLPPSDGLPVGSSCRLPETVFPARLFAEILIEHVRSSPFYLDQDTIRREAWERLMRQLQAGLSSETEYRKSAPALKSEASASNAPPDGVPASRPQHLLIGGRLNLNRIASDDELALKVDDYAHILKDFFMQAGDGELCFALFGPWGRGKTFQMQRLAKKLDADKKSKYATVFFSAWKYPNTPEVWVHLYETFARTAYPKNPFIKFPRLFRTGIAKHGSWPVITALFALALALFPKGDVGESRQTLVKAWEIVLGAGSVAWLSMLISKIWRTTKRLSKDYLTAAHHAEKLGLQATIGKDLGELLSGWIPQEFFPFDLALWLAPVVLWAIGASAWWQFSHAPPLIEHGFYFGLLLLGVLGLLFLLFGGKSPARVLLIVDDLDRCKPEQLLSVMESIKVLVEDPDISKRVQVAMLIEEDVLKHAILEKYKKLGTADKKTTIGPRWSDERIFRENCEKLFTAHLRLPPVVKEEMEELLTNIVAKGRKAREQIEGPQPLEGLTAKGMEEPNRVAQQDFIQMPTELYGDVADGVIRFPSETTESEAIRSALPQSAVHQATPLVTSNETTEMIFERADEDALSAALPLLSERYKGICGPRAVRAFVFRYQLARLLLNRLSKNGAWDPKALARGIARGSAIDVSSQEEEPPSPEMRRVIEQVS